MLGRGSRLGPYEVLTLIGTGGMGAVYRARDSRLNRDVAVKLVNEALVTDDDARLRFEREARVAVTCPPKTGPAEAGILQ